MPWFKLDDGFYDHPKFADLSDEAVALWIRGAAYCSRHLTDGFLKAGMANRLGSLVGATELESAGLWDAEDGGWQFHDWLDYQPSRVEVLANRDAAKERQKVARDPHLREAVKARDGNRCRYCGIAVQWKDKRGSSGGTYDHVVPTGGTTEANLVVACRGCNSSKGRRTPSEAGMRLIPLDQIRVGSKSDLDPIQVEPESAIQNVSVLSQHPDPTRPDLIREENSYGVLLVRDGIADAEKSRPEVESLCQHLADRIEAGGSKRPAITKRWRDAARLLLDRDGKTVEQVHAAIDWCQDDEFWRSNILSMPKLREKYDQLRLRAQATSYQPRPRHGLSEDQWAAAMARAEAKENR